MSNEPTFDPSPLQRLLESAFAIQESGFGLPSMSGIVDLQRSIVAGQLPLDAAMRRAAEQARAVAGASGIAIGLVEGDQLVYRAGSGSAASYQGRRVMATLTIPARNKPRAEILRVEDATSDNRIEAAICQQFEAKSLLILPIYSEQLAKGVLQVFFKEAHIFHEHEVAIYRLFAALVGEAVSGDRHAQLSDYKSSEAKNGGPISAPVPHETLASALDQITDPAICKTCGAPLAECERVAAEPVRESALINGERIASFISQRSTWARALAAAAMLAVVVWGVQKEGSHLSFAALSPQAPTLGRQVVSEPAGDMPSISTGNSNAHFVQTNSSLQNAGLTQKIDRDYGTSPSVSAVIVKHFPTRLSGAKARSAANPPVNTGIKHFGSDVTVRCFSPKSVPSQAVVVNGTTEVRHLSDDVTVRYFKPKTAEHQTTETAGKPSTAR